MSYSKTTLKIKIESLLIIRPKIITILEFFASRKRLSKTSDMNSLNASIRKHKGEELDNYDLLLFLSVLEESGIGKTRKEGTKLKFDWRYWVIPVFDKKNNLRALQVMDLAKESDLKENLSWVKRWENSKDYSKCSIVFKKRDFNKLGSCSLEELVKEIQNRGFTFNIKE